MNGKQRRQAAREIQVRLQEAIMLADDLRDQMDTREADVWDSVFGDKLATAHNRIYMVINSWEKAADEDA